MKNLNKFLPDLFFMRKTRNQIKRRSSQEEQQEPEYQRKAPSRINQYMEDLLDTCNQNTPRSEYSATSLTASVHLQRKTRSIRKQIKPKFTKLTSNYKYISLKKFKRSRKLDKFICYDESELNIPKQFATLLQKHKSDNDRETDDEQVKNAISYVQTDLFKCIQEEKKAKGGKKQSHR